MNKNIAIQGFEGSFHHVASEKFFGSDMQILPCTTFKDVIKSATDSDSCYAAVMAIENSIAGSILPNYNLLQKSNLTIIGEVYLLIKQNLLVLPETNIDDIKEVHSHPMAIQQCLDFLEKYHWKIVETEDTALSAKHIHQHKKKHTAAIAGHLAADIFNLKVVVPDIHTLKNNYTRFLVLQTEKATKSVENSDKASVNFHTDHSRGSLAKVLTRIAEGGINLSKLQSFPLSGTDFKYSFHADMEFKTIDQFDKVISSIQPLTTHLRIYGIYKNGKTEALLNTNSLHVANG